MKSNHTIFIIAGFGILGSVCLGFVVNLGNQVTNEYVDHNQEGVPVIREYDFRFGSKSGS